MKTMFEHNDNRRTKCKCISTFTKAVVESKYKYYNVASFRIFDRVKDSIAYTVRVNNIELATFIKDKIVAEHGYNVVVQGEGLFWKRTGKDVIYYTDFKKLILAYSNEYFNQKTADKVNAFNFALIGEL